jgi:starch synthase (maltosyl-transferring)
MVARPFTVDQALHARFTLTDVSPMVECGSFPAAAVRGEVVPFGVTAFREGHDSLSVDIRFTDPTGRESGPFPMHTGHDPDRYEILFQPDTEGLWNFTLTAWGNPWDTWRTRAIIKVPAGLDTDLELTEGAQILQLIANQLLLTADQRSVITSAVTTVMNASLPASVRLAAATDASIMDIVHEHPLRQSPTESGPWPLLVERPRALIGAWYEFFPRSEGASLAPLRSGTFATAAQRLPEIAAMGFDVVYLPPIHPIGVVNRKGPNNTLIAGAQDPGSPWAIGSQDGGHDSIHPDLGTVSDFTKFIKAAQDEGLEIALDLALQAAPDHPWVMDHPEWFTTRADGSIAYAENPPKKYQDIYPLNFDNDPEGLYAEVERVVRYWIDLGVEIFRVDNPHTKPVWVWNRLIHSINATHPRVIFLAEAFTRAPMMRALAQQGFQQSYTYFTWKTTKHDLEEYFTELAGPMSAYMRPNVFTNTPDILHEYLQSGMPAAFAIRATLAATLSPTYGIYSGFELFEHVSLRPGSEEYLDSEKFEYRPRDWDLAHKQGRTLAPYLTELNQIRRNNSALSSLRSLRFHSTDSPDIIAYSKQDHSNIVLVVCTLDPYHEHSTTVHWNMPALGLEWDSEFSVRDELTHASWRWNPHTFVRLNPYENVAHIARISSPITTEFVYTPATGHNP